MIRAGLWFDMASSKGEAFTRPISKRPPEITSIIANSSATRYGSVRLVIGTPRQSSLAFFVWRAKIASVSRQEADMQLAEAWCSLTKILKPS